MEEPSVYATPKAEGLEVSKFESFGGWLRFFQVINIISLVIVALVIVMIGVFQFMGEYTADESLDTFVAFIELIPGTVFAVMVLKIIKTKQSTIPNKITKYLGFYVAASLAIYAFAYYLFKTDVVSDKPARFWGSLIYYWIWLSYFKKSKRVKAYYGENAVG